MKDFDEIHRLLTEQRPVAWDAMPDIALYMDQVISYLPRLTVGTAEDVTLTPAMVNNYIKDGLLPRANGKRYGREHLAYLSAIALLKNVLSVKSIKLLLDEEVADGDVKGFYSRFLEKVDTSFEDVASVIDASIGSEDLAEFALDLAVTSCAAKVACDQLLDVLRERTEQSEPANEKRNEKSKTHEKKVQRGE